MTLEEASEIAVIFFKAEENRVCNLGMYEEAEEYEEALNIIKNSIEKQIPKKLNSVFCPNCGRLTLIDGAFLDRFNYCLHCGQKIDWSGL